MSSEDKPGCLTDIIEELKQLKAKNERLEDSLLYKEEYKNLCKFANQYEEERDKFKAALKELINTVEDSLLLDARPTEELERLKIASAKASTVLDD